jgi:hypothetical protein
LSMPMPLEKNNREIMERMISGLKAHVYRGE